MSEVSTRVEQYDADGHKAADWPALRDWLLNEYEWVVIKRYVDPQPVAEDTAGYREWDYPYIDGSWDEVRRLRTRGMLSKAEFDELMDARRAGHQLKYAKAS